jgi:hypothetical protein
MPEVWERGAESDVAWQAFQEYRDMGPERSLSKVARSLGKSTQLLAGWSSKHDWVRRVAEYDRYLDAQRVGATTAAIVEMSRRHASVAVLGLSKVVDWLSNVDGHQLPDAIGVRLLAETTRLERVARGVQLEEEGGFQEPPGPLRTLAEMFQQPREGEVVVSELELSRIIVERHQAGQGDELDDELADLLDDPDDGEDPEGPDDDPAAAPLPVAAEVDEVALAWEWLRQNPRRPPAGPELVQWLRARRLVGLDPEPSDRPGPRRRRRRES